MDKDEIERLQQERQALLDAVTILLEAKKEKAANGKTQAYKRLAATGWQHAEDAVYFIQTR
jgi:hypothetical protein